MSADTVAAPRLSLNVRYNRNVEENSGEEEESQVEILEDEEHHADLGPQRARPHTPNNPAANNRRCFRATAVTLGGFYLLILAGLFIRYILVTLAKERMQNEYDQLSKNYSQLQVKVSEISVNNSQLQSSYQTLSVNNSQLQSSYQTLSVNNSQLQSSYQTLSVNNSQLQSSYQTLSVNNSQLQSSYQTLSVNNSQLQDEVKKLKDRNEETRCPDGWKRFRSSCYFKTNGFKTWYESRADCQQRVADLVIINNEEAQEFVTELSKNGESWIGLRKIYTYTGQGWKWVDGSPLTETFWAEGLPSNNSYHATCCNQGKWTQGYTYKHKNWICEKKIL